MRQRLQTTVRIVGLLAALGALGALAPAAHAQAVTTQLWLAFPSTATLNGETVGFSGAVHVVVRAIPSDSNSPLDPCRFYVNLVNVLGIGQTSGATYYVTGAASFTSPDAPHGTFVFDAGYLVTQPVDPCRRSTPTDPCQRVLALRHTVSVNADGVATSASVAIAPPGDVDSSP